MCHHQTFDPTCFVHSVDDLVDLPSGEVNTGTEARFGVINTKKACEINNQNIVHYRSQWIDGLDLCKKLCLSEKSCRAIDWYRSTKWCNLYKEPCLNPQQTKFESSSYFVNNFACAGEQCTQVGSGDGMMGILGNRQKYVCNVVETIVAHSPYVSERTLVSKSDHRFWHSADTTRPASKGKRRSVEQSAIAPGGAPKEVL